MVELPVPSEGANGSTHSNSHGALPGTKGDKPPVSSEQQLFEMFDRRFGALETRMATLEARFEQIFGMVEHLL